MHELRLVVARLARDYRCPLSEVLAWDLDELHEWSEIIPDLEPEP